MGGRYHRGERSRRSREGEQDEVVVWCVVAMARGHTSHLASLPSGAYYLPEIKPQDKKLGILVCSGDQIMDFTVRDGY